jgi:hypothetical protein
VRPRRMRAGQIRGTLIAIAIAVLAPAVAPSAAGAASPILEFVTSPSPLPVNFTATGGEVTAELADFDTVVHCSGSHGEGAITGARSTLSIYDLTGCGTEGGSKGGEKCESAGAGTEEIHSPLIEAELVFIDQATGAVGMLLDPHGGVYLSFECGGEAVKAFGPFLSPVGPINAASSLFTASLSHVGATQVPFEYENDAGQKLPAVPTGEREGQAPGSTGVELSFAIHTASPLTVRAVTAVEVAEAKRAEEAIAEADAKRRQEEAARAAADKQRKEEEVAMNAAAQKRLEEEVATQNRARHLTKALKQCKKVKPGHQRARCESRAKKKFGPRPVARASRA